MLLMYLPMRLHGRVCRMCGVEGVWCICGSEECCELRLTHFLAGEFSGQFLFFNLRRRSVRRWRLLSEVKGIS